MGILDTVDIQVIAVQVFQDIAVILDILEWVHQDIAAFLDIVDIQVNQGLVGNQDILAIQAAVFLGTVDILDQAHQAIQVILAKLVHRVCLDILDFQA